MGGGLSWRQARNRTLFGIAKKLFFPKESLPHCLVFGCGTFFSGVETSSNIGHTQSRLLGFNRKLRTPASQNYITEELLDFHKVRKQLDWPLHQRTHAGVVLDPPTGILLSFGLSHVITAQNFLPKMKKMLLGRGRHKKTNVIFVIAHDC